MNPADDARREAQVLTALAAAPCPLGLAEVCRGVADLLTPEERAAGRSICLETYRPVLARLAARGAVAVTLGFRKGTVVNRLLYALPAPVPAPTPGKRRSS